MFDTQTSRAGSALASSFLSGCIRFWATSFNRKSSLFPFNVPWRNQICIAKCIALIEAGFQNICAKPLPKNPKSLLPVEVCCLKKLLFRRCSFLLRSRKRSVRNGLGIRPFAPEPAFICSHLFSVSILLPLCYHSKRSKGKGPVWTPYFTWSNQIRM